MNFRKGSKRPLTPTSPPQNYGLRGQQIGSTCQAHLVRIPISISQTFLEQFVLVYIRVMANILTISISHTDECNILSILSRKIGLNCFSGKSCIFERGEPTVTDQGRQARRTKRTVGGAALNSSRFSHR